MNLKEYREMPPEGLYAKIQRRLAVRRAMRVGGIAVAAVVVAGAAVWMLWPKADAGVVEVAQQAAVQDVATVIEPTSEPVGVPEVVTKPVADNVGVADNRETAASVTAEDAPAPIAESDMASLLPSNMPVVSQPIEPREEPRTEQWEPPIPEADADADMRRHSDDGTVDAATADKAGVPNPHFDNVIWAPNMIIPSGDVDENRRFSIKTTSTITNFRMHVYNRNGRRIYLTTDPSFNWDATMDGTPVPQGAYVWVATFRDSDGNPRQESGTVTVIR